MLCAEDGVVLRCALTSGALMREQMATTRLGMHGLISKTCL